MHCFFQTTGQDAYKRFAVPWVTASQEQLLMKEGVLKGFFPALPVTHAGGVKIYAFPLHVYHPMAL